ncbi:unnamed protein product [Paramecium octaurelia]|uniref:Phospho-2-dehydro-3-deoxyheptonate aldolase n=1 Tax=Paramecium octaurelia TaxID=43137 RepID=A0A8S1S359_PAROT|nr:unnamed protein product [Paramecium octaurelia]
MFEFGYESAFVRLNEEDQYHLLQTHYPWIGDRTRLRENSHSNFAKRIQNHIGIKNRSSINKSQCINLIKLLNPKMKMREFLLQQDQERINQTNLKEIINWKHEEKLIVSLDPMNGNI